MDKKKVINFSKESQKFKKKRIKEDEINSLFLELIKIVKKWAIHEVDFELRSECEEAKGNFTQTLKELHETQIRLKREKVENYKLHEKIEKQQKQICLLISQLGANSGSVLV